MLALFIGLLALVVAWTVAAVLAFRALIWIVAVMFRVVWVSAVAMVRWAGLPK